MRSLNEKPQICWTCEENEATEPYIYRGRTTWICATCLPRRRARDELDRIDKQIIELEDPGQVDALLASLDAFMEANSKYDNDRRLARMAAHSRVTLLREAGRYDEAERVCKAWAELGFM